MVGGVDGASHPRPVGKPGPQKCSRFDTHGSVGSSGAPDGSIVAVSSLPRGRLRSACNRLYFLRPFHRPQLAAFWPQWAHLGPFSPGAGRLVPLGLGSGVSDLVRPLSLPHSGWGQAPFGRTGHGGPFPLPDPGGAPRPISSFVRLIDLVIFSQPSFGLCHFYRLSAGSGAVGAPFKLLVSFA